jgi:hypothetical protein
VSPTTVWLVGCYVLVGVGVIAGGIWLLRRRKINKRRNSEAQSEQALLNQSGIFYEGDAPFTD